MESGLEVMAMLMPEVDLGDPLFYGENAPRFPHARMASVTCLGWGEHGRASRR